MFSIMIMEFPIKKFFLIVKLFYRGKIHILQIKDINVYFHGKGLNGKMHGKGRLG
jgi:hypothetical protein